MTSRTRLDLFMEQHAVSLPALAAACGLAPSALDRLRQEDGDPTLTTMRAVRDGCRKVTGTRVMVSELFDVGD